MNASTKVLTYNLVVNVQKQPDSSFVVKAKDWADCYAQGDTLEEAMLEVTAVAQSLIELYQEEGMRIPLKKTEEKTLKSPHFSLPIIVTA